MNLSGRSARMLFLVVGVGVLLAGGLTWWHVYTRSCMVTLYERARDFDTLVRIFAEDTYWLDERPAAAALASFGHELDLIDLPEAVPTHEGPMQWRVCRIGSHTVGFVSFFMKQADVGRILYLGVDRSYRHYGAGRALMLAAMQALEQQGAKVIMLATRIDNLRAQGLYQQLGFTTASSTGSFIFMERYLA